jgi:hypothetical protein
VILFEIGFELEGLDVVALELGEEGLGGHCLFVFELGSGCWGGEDTFSTCPRVGTRPSWTVFSRGWRI